jgi:hypothetical protein
VEVSSFSEHRNVKDIPSNHMEPQSSQYWKQEHSKLPKEKKGSRRLGNVFIFFFLTTIFNGE